jgi:nucleoside-diphosphate-sugar epimerase
MSSAGVVGCAPDKIITEETACRPQNRYEVSKYWAEKSAVDFYHKHRLPVTILRPANVLWDLEPEKHLLNLMRQLQNGRFRFIDRKEARLNYVYAGDVAEACLLAAQENRTVGQIYRVSDPCRLREFVEAVSKMFGVDLRQRRIPLGLAYGFALGFKAVSTVIRRRWPLTFDKIAIFRSQTIHCAEKLENKFCNWPRFGWGGGVKRTLSWYRAQEWL